MCADSASPRPTAAFISYSRKDTGLVERLLLGLQTRNIHAYLDRKDIAAGEAWRDRLGRLIAASDAVVFVMSPDSAASDVCRWEVQYAHDLGKRLLPVVCRELGSANVPELLAQKNYIFARSDAELQTALDSLAGAIEQDIDLVREHTRLADLASNWDAKGRLHSALLRGDALVEAERWRRAADQRISAGIVVTDFLNHSRSEFDADEAARAKLVSDMFRFQSDQLAIMADQSLQKGDPVNALYLAICSVPDANARLEEIRTRPLTPRAIAALFAARRDLTNLSFLRLDDGAKIKKVVAAPSGAFFCVIGTDCVRMFSGSPPFQALTDIQFDQPVRAVAFSGDSKRLLILLYNDDGELLDVPGLQSRFRWAWVKAETMALDWTGQIAFAETSDGLHAFRFEGEQRIDLLGGSGNERAKPQFVSTIDRGTAIASTMTPIVELVGDGHVQCLALSMRVNLWLAVQADRVSIRSLAAPGDEIAALQLPPGGKLIAASFSADGSACVLTEMVGTQVRWTVWSSQGQLRAEVAGSADERSKVQCALTADGLGLITMEGKRLACWDAMTGHLLGDETLVVALNPWAINRELLISPSPHGERFSVLLDAASEEAKKTFQLLVFRFPELGRVDHALSPFDVEGAYGFAWSPDAKWFAAYGHSKWVTLQYLDDPRRMRRLAHEGYRMDDGVRSAAFSHDSRKLVTGSCDQTAKLWDVGSGALLATLEHKREVRRTLFSHDDLFAITLDDANILRLFPTGHDQSVAEFQLPPVADLWPGDSNGDIYFVDTSNRLHVLAGVTNIQGFVDDSCRSLPRGLDSSERLGLGLSADIPDWNTRNQKWPALLGESTNDVTSVGEAINMVRNVTSIPAKALLRQTLETYPGANIDALAELALMVWDHYAGAVRHLSNKYNLSSNNSDFELAADVFSALVDAAEEFRSPELPLAMVARYRGPAGGSFEKWRAKGR